MRRVRRKRSRSGAPRGGERGTRHRNGQREVPAPAGVFCQPVVAEPLAPLGVRGNLRGVWGVRSEYKRTARREVAPEPAARWSGSCRAAGGALVLYLPPRQPSPGCRWSLRDLGGDKRERSECEGGEGGLSRRAGPERATRSERCRELPSAAPERSEGPWVLSASRRLQQV